MIIVTVTTETILDIFFNHFKAKVFANVECPSVTKLLEVIESIARGSKINLKQAFKDGYIRLFLNSLQLAEVINAKAEKKDFMIVVTHKSKAILALLPDDILIPNE